MNTCGTAVYTVTFSSAIAGAVDKAMLAITLAAKKIFFIWFSHLCYKLYLTSFEHQVNDVLQGSVA